MRKLKTVQLGLGYATVVDGVLASQPRELLLQAASFDAWKLRYRFHVDVKRVEEKSAVGKIRTRFLRLIVKPGVQRVEPDARGAEIGSKIDEGKEIGKIAMAPIAQRPHPVKLNCQPPHPPLRSRVALIRLPRTNNERRFLAELTLRSHHCNAQTKDAVWQVQAQRHEGRGILPLGNLLIRKDFPVERQPFGGGQADIGNGAAANDDRARQYPPQRILVVGKDSEQAGKDLRLDLAQLPESVPILSFDPHPSRALKNVVHCRRALQQHVQA